jgi:hypothetical protein
MTNTLSPPQKKSRTQHCVSAEQKHLIQYDVMTPWLKARLESCLAESTQQANQVVAVPTPPFFMRDVLRIASWQLNNSQLRIKEDIEPIWAEFEASGQRDEVAKSVLLECGRSDDGTKIEFVKWHGQVRADNPLQPGLSSNDDEIQAVKERFRQLLGRAQKH